VDAAFGHALALSDQVDECAEEREHEHEQAPAGFRPAGDVAPEDVAEDQDQHPDPGDPEEEQDHRPEDIHERVVRCEHHGLPPLEVGRSFVPPGVTGPHPLRVRVRRRDARAPFDA
jgi:hypothetical protein